MSGKPIIQVQNLSKKYRIGKKSEDLRESLRNIFSFSKEKPVEIWALKDINFEVNQGEVFGIIGPNGSGKSTLLKILSKITYPTSGKAILRGRVSSLLEVGTGFHPELTGRENIYLNGSILGMKRAEIKKKFDEIVDFSGVEQFIDTPVKHYSSGMYVRLAFSVAAFLEPDILLVDEVLSVGDMAFRQKSMGKMNEVAQSGRTVLFVSHNLGAVKNLCKRGIRLENGKISSKGFINDVISEYLVKVKRGNKKISIYKNTTKINLFEVYLKDRYNKISNSFQSGEKINLVFNIESKINLLNLRIRIEVMDSEYNLLFICNNRLTGDNINIKKSNQTIICSINKIPLNTGKYFINTKLKDNNKKTIASIDNIDLLIYPGYFYFTGKIPSKDSSFLVEQNWKIDGME